jgi:hypothetical protein
MDERSALSLLARAPNKEAVALLFNACFRCRHEPSEVCSSSMRAALHARQPRKTVAPS